MRRQRSFIEETATEALRKAKEEYGPDVIILETKKIKSPQIGKFLVEVVVSVDEELEDAKANRIRHKQIVSRYGSHTTFDDEVKKSSFQIEHQEEIAQELDQLSSKLNNLEQERIAQNQALKNTKQTKAPNTALTPTITTNEIEQSKNAQAFMDFKNQIHTMQKNISIIRNSLKNDFLATQKDGSNLVIPPEFQGIYEHFKTNELSDKLIDMILSKTISSVPLVIKSDEYKLHKFFGAIMSKIAVTKDESINGGNIVFMVCGGSGSGKSTSVFKIANKLSQQEGIKVACISLAKEDSYHNKMFEALALSYNTYYEFAPTAIKLREILDNLSDYKYILLDTSGINFYKDMDLLLQYKMQIRYATAKTLLVLGSDTKLKDYNLIYNAHKRLDIQSIIATKLDITNSIGNLISFVYENKIPISYVSWGESIDEFDNANSDFISKAFMDIGSVSVIKTEYENKEAK